MENFTEENFVGIKEYVMDLKVVQCSKILT